VADRPLVLVHGYSDSAEGFERWRKIIHGWGRPTESVHIGQYVSLSNEVTLKDVAEGFDRALRDRVGLGTRDDFDAIVHSTGMLVVRAWLNSYSEGKKRRKRLKRLIALAPATNGSPLAHKGRSWMGSIFKGNRERGPDFMEAGDEILYNLELASRFTWDLAHDDLIRDGARFRPGPETPFVFTFCGNRNYGFWKNLVTDEKGSDGTVRWAGAPLNSRKITIDLRVPPGSRRKPKYDFSDWANQDHPLILIDGLDHGTIMSKPSKLLQGLVRDALTVETAKDFTAWNRHGPREDPRRPEEGRRLAAVRDPRRRRARRPRHRLERPALPGRRRRPRPRVRHARPPLQARPVPPLLPRQPRRPQAEAAHQPSSSASSPPPAPSSSPTTATAASASPPTARPSTPRASGTRWWTSRRAEGGEVPAVLRVASVRHDDVRARSCLRGKEPGADADGGGEPGRGVSGSPNFIRERKPVGGRGVDVRFFFAANRKTATAIRPLTADIRTWDPHSTDLGDTLTPYAPTMRRLGPTYGPRCVRFEAPCEPHAYLFNDPTVVTQLRARLA
jgi:hypothetical protein